jgi:hypothetical protein
LEFGTSSPWHNDASPCLKAAINRNPTVREVRFKESLGGPFYQHLPCYLICTAYPPEISSISRYRHAWLDPATYDVSYPSAYHDYALSLHLHHTYRASAHGAVDI